MWGSEISEAQSLLKTGPRNFDDLSDSGVWVQIFCKTLELIRLTNSVK